MEKYLIKNTAIDLLEERIRSGETIDFEMASESMLPLLRKDNLVSIKKTTLARLKKGDLILYKLNKTFYVHRYIKTEIKRSGAEFLITKGDNIFHFDKEGISQEQLLGKVVRIKGSQGTIDVNSGRFRIANKAMFVISSSQGYILCFLQTLRRVLLKNKVFKPGEYIRDGICNFFFIIQKFIMLLSQKGQKS